MVVRLGSGRCPASGHAGRCRIWPWLRPAAACAAVAASTVAAASTAAAALTTPPERQHQPCRHRPLMPRPLMSLHSDWRAPHMRFSTAKPCLESAKPLLNRMRSILATCGCLHWVLVHCPGSSCCIMLPGRAWFQLTISQGCMGMAQHDMIGLQACLLAHKLQGFLMHGAACLDSHQVASVWCCSLSLRHGRRCCCPRRRPRRPCCPSMATGTAWTCARPARCPSRKTRAFTARAAAAPVSGHRCGRSYVINHTLVVL